MRADPVEVRRACFIFFSPPPGAVWHGPAWDSRLVVLPSGSYLCSEPCLVSRVFFRLPLLVVSAVGVGVRRVRALCPDSEVPMRDVVVDVCYPATTGPYRGPSSVCNLA